MLVYIRDPLITASQAWLTGSVWLDISMTTRSCCRLSQSRLTPLSASSSPGHVTNSASSSADGNVPNFSLRSFCNDETQTQIEIPKSYFHITWKTFLWWSQFVWVTLMERVTLLMISRNALSGTLNDVYSYKYKKCATIKDVIPRIRKHWHYYGTKPNCLQIDSSGQSMLTCHIDRQ